MSGSHAALTELDIKYNKIKRESSRLLLVYQVVTTTLFMAINLLINSILTSLRKYADVLEKYADILLETSRCF